MALLGDRGRFFPKGLQGGNEALGTKVSIVRTSGEVYVPAALTKDDSVKLYAGDILRVCTPGGAGYGPYSKRDEDALRDDALCEYYENGSVWGVLLQVVRGASLDYP